MMAKLIANGVEITAIHNHLLRASPAPFYMHVGGHGDPMKLATAIRAGSRGEQNAVGSACDEFPSVRLSTLTRRNSTKSSERKVSRMAGCTNLLCRVATQFRKAECRLTPAGPMGVATSINFQPTGGGKAAITGDFVLVADEVNPVIKALRENGIEVTAVHSHMLTEQPRLFFMHFWANDEAIKLAKGLRAALDKIAIAKG